MDFTQHDSLLSLLTSQNLHYEEIFEISQNLLSEIPEMHKNFSGEIFASAITQCILECFKRKFDFHSTIWYSAKRIDNTIVKPNAAPVSFNRLVTEGQTIHYEFYNADQLNIATLPFEPSKTIRAKDYLVSPTLSSSKSMPQTNKNLEYAILAFVREFNGEYGRSGISKILKGSQSVKDNGFNTKALKSNYFGMFSELTIRSITKTVDDLLDKKMLYLKKMEYGRPLVCIKKDTDISSFEADKEVFLPIKMGYYEPKEDDDENFRKILEFIKNGENIFITGHAGTGKSYILGKLKNRFSDLVVTSTTGIAAVNVKGQTIHSWAGVGICNKPLEQAVEKILRKSSVKRGILKCKILAVDEISMLDIRTFEYVDAVLRKIREIDKPFGGIQVIFIGDFYQLPPVNKKENIDEHGRKYCFESQLWNEFDLKTVVLEKNYRQNEENLIKALADMRINSLDENDIELLKTRECEETEELSDILHIFATNREADNYNEIKFSQVKNPTYQLSAKDVIYRNGEPIETPKTDSDFTILRRIDDVCNADKIISLKEGVRVMLLTNLDFDKGLINGSCGVVDEITDNYVRVLFDNGVISNVARHDFEFYNNEVLIAARKQFPLRLAYGITIHKSQGMSLDKLVVDCSRIFERGQIYVALSRIKTLAGLYLHGFNPNKVMVDEKVCEFYKHLFD